MFTSVRLAVVAQEQPTCPSYSYEDILTYSPELAKRPLRAIQLSVCRDRPLCRPGGQALTGGRSYSKTPLNNWRTKWPKRPLTGPYQELCYSFYVTERRGQTVATPGYLHSVHCLRHAIADLHGFGMWFIRKVRTGYEQFLHPHLACAVH
jgi:hypothetical protein